jgi:transposase-like protein
VFAISDFKRKNNFVCYQFLKQLRRRYGLKPIHTDGAYWYSDACKWLRLKHYIPEIEMKDLVERFIQQIKDRTQNVFRDDHFPCRIREIATDSIYNELA